MSESRRIALKVDCDTFEGTKTGLPRLLQLFDKHSIRASFFFTLGPDHSGRAIRRVFTQRGFLKKMMRSNAVSLYGPKTMMYGTLLPGPDIGKKLAEEIRSVARAGHHVGVHAWDHVRWHDQLDRMTEAEIESDYGHAHVAFERIFGWKATASAAPGWHATPASLAVQERFGIRFSSDTRRGTPFFPRAGNRLFSFLEIPTTLPTWDETMSDPIYRETESLVAYYRSLIASTEIHTIHTEVEGGAMAGAFDRLLSAWRSDGTLFATLEEIAVDTLRNRAEVPACELRRITLPHRAGLVTSGMDLASTTAR